MHRCLIPFLLLISCLGLSAKPLDDIPLFQINQGETTAYELREETRYVAFYYSASWCPPCRTTTPALVKEYQRMLTRNSLPVEIVLVGDDRTEAVMIDYIKRYDMPWPAVQWHAREMVSSYAARGIPHLALVERSSGNIIAAGTGASGDGSIETVVAKIREITGDTTEEPFQTGNFLSRYGVLIAIGVTVILIMLITRLRRSKK